MFLVDFTCPQEAMSGVYSCMNLRPDYMFEETLGKCDKKRAAGMEEPHLPKSDEMAECSSQPHQPLVCDTFKNCEGPSHVVFMDGKGVVMLGKVMSCEQESEAASAYSADGRAKKHRSRRPRAVAVSRRPQASQASIFCLNVKTLTPQIHFAFWNKRCM